MRTVLAKQTRAPEWRLVTVGTTANTLAEFLVAFWAFNLWRAKSLQIHCCFAANTGAHKRALARVRLLNGFADARETVEEVMLAVRNDDPVI